MSIAPPKWLASIEKLSTIEQLFRRSIIRNCFPLFATALKKQQYIFFYTAAKFGKFGAPSSIFTLYEHWPLKDKYSERFCFL
jgi:hypothetical protein